MSRREEEKQNKKQNKEDKFWFKPAHVASQSLTPNTYDDIHGKGTYTSRAPFYNFTLQSSSNNRTKLWLNQRRESCY